MGTAAPALSATSTSGLSVSFASSTTGVCTVSGTTLTLVSAGNCTIRANQAGNTGYAAAAQVSSTFTVAAAPAATGSATAGKALYTGNACFACHGTPPSQKKILNGANLTTLTNSFKNVGEMTGYSFTSQQLLDMNAYLKTPNI
jgi:mono/diheme cytochrome c family protein